MVKTWQENRDTHEHLNGPISTVVKHELMQAEIDGLRERLVELEEQEPIAYLWKNCEGCYSTISETQKGAINVIAVYASAGASLVATTIVAWAKSTPRKLRITTMDMGGEDGWRPLGYTAAGASPVEPSQAL